MTESVQDFIVLITMGYYSIEDRLSLNSAPSENYAAYNDRTWPDPIEIKQHAQSMFGVTYPLMGEGIAAKDVEDPFAKFVEESL